jgi:sugar fermentation stimulation protein A
MKYKEVVKGAFIERPNRFIAKVLIDENEETVHVKNTGRCKELLIKGSTVYLSVSDNSNRKTKYDLIGVDKITENGALKINMDSQIPNDAVWEWLKKGNLFSDKAIIKGRIYIKLSLFSYLH